MYSTWRSSPASLGTTLTGVPSGRRTTPTQEELRIRSRSSASHVSCRRRPSSRSNASLARREGGGWCTSRSSYSLRVSGSGGAICSALVLLGQGGDESLWVVDHVG